MVLRMRAISDRYTYDAEERGAGMLSVSEEQREARMTLPANMVQPGPAHRAVMLAVDQILTMGLTSGNSSAAPPMLRSAVRLLRRLEPLMLEEISKIPEAEVLQLMRTLAMGITQLADSVDNGSNDRPILLATPSSAQSPPA
jgi:hypothetical protein